MAKKIHTEKPDVIGGTCIRGDDGNLSLDDASRKLAWRQHYEHLLNIEFPWSQNLPHVDHVAVPAQFITPDDVSKPTRHTKNWKTTGSSGVVAEMWKVAPDICKKIIADLIKAIIRERKVPSGGTASLLVYLKEKEMV